MIRRLLLSCAAFSVLLAAPAYADSVSALKAAERENWSLAQREAGQGVARDLVTWMYLMSDKTRASFSEIAAFVTRHPDWPGSEKLFKVAETRLPDDISQGQVIAWFTRNKPVTGDGMKRYMDALLSQRRTQEAMAGLKEWWVKANLSASEQDMIISRYGRYLGTPDHVRRLERMITDKQYTTARALAPRLGRGYAGLAETRISLQEGKRGVESQLRNLPNGLLEDAGLKLSRIQWRRQNDLTNDAIALLNTAPPASQTTDPAAWWKERHILARRMIEVGRYKDAYKLAANHGLASEGSDFAAAEFLAGWLALRFTHQPYAAFEHFEKLFNNVSSPISRARGAYWAGRASEAMNGRDIAVQWFQVAARYPTTFYGQEAAKRINLPIGVIQGNKPPITSGQQASFNARDMVQATRLLHRAGLSHERGQFLKTMLDVADTPQDYTLLSDFAVSMGQIDMALKVAKQAERTGLYLTDYSFPTIMHTVGDYGADKALVHALIRQESQFDANAISPSGALGLMQIMPATGKHTAKNNGLLHQTAWLTVKPDHNVKIGSLYIREMLDRYKGFMPLAIAAYNAGPGRVDSWIREFGDPRDPRVDMIDWMESIPIYETRNYVQRVMEGYTVYKSKLARYQGGTESLHTAYNP